MRWPEDGLRRFGAIATLIWLAIVAYVVARSGDGSFNTGIERLIGKGLSGFGDFSAGVTAPLAFLWLVLGFEQQRRVTDAAAADVHTDRSIQLINASLAQLHELAHCIHHRWLHPCEAIIDPNASEYAVLKAQYDSGDRPIFCREINDRLSGAAKDIYMQEFVKRSSLFALVPWTKQYIALYAQLVNMSQSKTLKDYLDTIPHIEKTNCILTSAINGFEASQAAPQQANS